MARMALIQDEDDTDEAVLTLFHGARELLAWTSYFARTAAYAPHMARWWIPMIAAIQRGGEGANLEPRIKELVVLKTSTLNECAFCTGHNVNLGRLAGLTTDEIEAVSGDDWASWPTFDDRDRAAVLWADRVTRNIADGDVEARRQVEAQFSEVEVVELTLVSCLFAMLNRFNDSLWLDLDDTGAPAGSNLHIPQASFARYASTMYGQAGVDATP